MHTTHLLQSDAWGELKSRFDWTAQRIVSGHTGALVLFRRLPLGLTVAYIPRGPDVNWLDTASCESLLMAVHSEAKKRRAVFLKVEPDVWRVEPLQTMAPPASVDLPEEQAGAAARFLEANGFHPADTIQPRSSIVVDISPDEATILAAMKQKTRYNIRLAEKKGVTVRLGNRADVSIFYNLALTTAGRDGFAVHSLAYYQAAYDLFAPDRCALLLAEYQGAPLAALLVFCQGQTAYYFYGASANEHRELMPAYLVQWAAIRWARGQGCTRYDLWGVPDAGAATLEAEFQHRHDGLWGVYRFKRGFGGQVVRTIGAYDYVYNAPLYRLYKLRRQL